MNRRDMLKITGAAVGGASLFGASAFAQTGDSAKKPKVLVIGAHPDDPETTSGGTILMMKEAGYEVVVVYMTKGQSGIKGKSHDEAASIRTQESTNACQVMGVRPIFLTQVDGYTEINVERYDEMRELINRGGSRSSELHHGLHGGVDAVVTHQLFLRDQLRNHSADSRRLNTCACGAKEGHAQQCCQHHGLRRDARHEEQHSQCDQRNQRIRAYDQPFSIPSVRPNPADKRNEKLRKIGTNRKSGYPHAAFCLQGHIPHNGHLNDLGAKQRNGLTEEKQEGLFLPMAWGFHLFCSSFG